MKQRLQDSLLYSPITGGDIKANSLETKRPNQRGMNLQDMISLPDVLKFCG